VSDQELRALEREVLQAPASLDLRRRHVRALQRAGDDDRALSALDLAWRLGADELWDELRAGCAARQLTVRGVVMCYVPGGPFAMGADDQDEDAAPLHLVHLSPFYVAQAPPPWRAFDGWRQVWPLNSSGAHREAFLGIEPRGLSHADASDAVRWFGQQAAAEGGLRGGRWSLVSEAQWERLARAALLRPDGALPYGLAWPTGLEWTADRYDPAAYDGPRRDPLVTGAPGDLVAVRGMPGLPRGVVATYREAATADGRFEVETLRKRLRSRPGTRTLAHERGVAFRPVFVPEAPAS
jgi:formylglycine-generating enzyme required for sulfatase activity